VGDFSCWPPSAVVVASLLLASIWWDLRGLLHFMLWPASVTRGSGIGVLAAENLMRNARNFNPEWGYIASAPSVVRTDCLIVLAAIIFATAGVPRCFLCCIGR
jgi:hypothetical protein